MPPGFPPGGGGSSPPATGRGLAPAASFFLMFCDSHSELYSTCTNFWQHVTSSCEHAHPNADLDGLSLFEAQVQFRGFALSGLEFCQLTFLFDPPLVFKSITIITERVLDIVI